MVILEENNDTMRSKLENDRAQKLNATADRGLYRVDLLQFFEETHMKNSVSKLLSVMKSYTS